MANIRQSILAKTDYNKFAGHVRGTANQRQASIAKLENYRASGGFSNGPQQPSTLDAIISSITSPFQRVSKGVVAATGGYDKLTEARAKAVETATDAYVRTLQRKKQGKATDREVASAKFIMDQASGKVTENTAEIADITNKRKFAGAAYEVGLTPFLLSPSGLTGTGKLYKATTGLNKIQSGKIVKASTLPAKSTGRIVAEEAISGGLMSIPATAQKDNPTVKDYFKEAGINTTIGMITGGGPKVISKATKGLDTATTKAVKGVFDSRGAQALAQTTAGQAVNKGLRRAADIFVDDMAKIKRHFGNTTDKQGRKITEVIDSYNLEIMNARGKTDELFKTNKSLQEFKALANTKERAEELGKFISAKQDAINKNKLGEAVAIPKGTPEQEKAYELMNKATKDAVELMHKTGTINDTVYKKYLKDGDFTRVQRIVEKSAFQGRGARASFGSSVAQQRLKGGKAEVVDPVASLYDWYNRLHTEQARNKLASYVIDNLGAQGKGKLNRVADRVIARQEIYKELKDSKPLKQSLEKLLKQNNKVVKALDKEIALLKKEGNKKLLAKAEELKNFMIKKSSGAERLPGKGKQVVGPIKNPEDLLHEFIKSDKSGLRDLFERMSKKSEDVAGMRDDLASLSSTIQRLSSERQQKFLTARALGDTKGYTDNQIYRFKKGVKEIFETEPEIAKAIKSVGTTELNAIQKVGLGINRFFRDLTTLLNPVFVAKNYVRDQIFSAINTRDLRATHNPAIWFRALKESTGYAGKTIAGKDGGFSKEFRLFLRDNAQMTEINLYRDLKKTADAGYEALGLKDKSLKAKAGRGRTHLENFLSSGEMGTRYQNWLGTYKKAIKNGVEPEEALRQANLASARNSINFKSQGEMANWMRAVNPFLPASIQGSRTLARSFKEAPVTTALKVGGTIIMPTTLATYHNLSDPERAAIYANIPEYERERNLIWVFGGGRGYMKVPMPPGVVNMSKPMRNLIEAEYLGDRQGFMETAKNLLIDPFSPLGTSKNEAVSTLVPQAAKPVLEVAINKDLFTGREIVPDNLKDAPKGEQTFKNTSQLYRDIGKVLNVSPLKVRKIIVGYSSSVGEQTVSNIDLAREVAGQKVTRDKRNTVAQLIGSFYSKEPPGGGAVQSKFYENYNKVRSNKEYTSKQITAAVKADDLQKARSLADEINRQIDAETKKFQEQYGKYETNSDLINKLNALKINLTDRSIKSRKKQK